MFVSKIAPLGSVPNYLKNRSSENRTISNAISTQSNSFQAKPIENLIVPNLFAYEFLPQANFSKKLLEIFKDEKVVLMKMENDTRKKTAIFQERFEDANGCLKQAIINITRENSNFADLKVGFTVGKAGTYAVIKSNKFALLIPQGVDLEAENGNFHISYKVEDVDIQEKKDLNFKGRDKAVVNCYYRAEQTHKAVDNFFKKIVPRYLSSDQKVHEQNLEKFQDKFQAYMLAGGFGSRLEPVTEWNKHNKPSASTIVKNLPLAGFTLYNLWLAGLIDKEDDMCLVDQEEANSAVGCVITTAGYSIKRDGKIELKHDSESDSLVSKDKNIVIVPADNVTDIELSRALDEFLNKKDAGMMIVGVADKRAYGGLIIRDPETNEMVDFISKEDEAYINKQNKEKYIDKFLKRNAKKPEGERIDVEKYGKITKTSTGERAYLGNGFIYIFHPDMMDVVAQIYNDSIVRNYDAFLKKREYTSANQLSSQEKDEIIEGLWDREIIPEMIRKAKNGELVDKKGYERKCYVYPDADCDWNDVGQISSYSQTMYDIASDDKYKHFPESLKNVAKTNIETKNGGGNILFFNMDGDTKEEIDKLLPDMKIRGGDVLAIKLDDSIGY